MIPHRPPPARFRPGAASSPRSEISPHGNHPKWRLPKPLTADHPQLLLTPTPLPPSFHAAGAQARAPGC